MFYNRATLQNPRVLAHWQTLWNQREAGRTAFADFLANHGQTLANLTGTPLVNASDAFGVDFWKEIDRQAEQLRQATIGWEIVEDLMPLQKVTNVGKTVRTYPVLGEIAKDVSVSIDGQAPYSFDHTEYVGDGDPIPAFTAGYGVNWRHFHGLTTVGVDLVLDSQEAKMRHFHERIVKYFLYGDDNIVVDKYPAQGLINHRNTQKIDLGQQGAAIDLSAATLEQLVTFFGGAFRKMLMDNRVAKYDVMWVSPEIWANWTKPNVIKFAADPEKGLLSNTIVDQLQTYMNVGAIRPTYALKGNQFVAYVRNQSVVAPLTGMPISVWALPRFMPQHNYNLQIMAVLGLSVRADANGHSGVLAGA